MPQFPQMEDRINGTGSVVEGIKWDNASKACRMHTLSVATVTTHNDTMI